MKWLEPGSRQCCDRYGNTMHARKVLVVMLSGCKTDWKQGSCKNINPFQTKIKLHGISRFNSYLSERSARSESSIT